MFDFLKNKKEKENPASKPKQFSESFYDGKESEMKSEELPFATSIHFEQDKQDNAEFSSENKEEKNFFQKLFPTSIHFKGADKKNQEILEPTEEYFDYSKKAKEFLKKFNLKSEAKPPRGGLASKYAYIAVGVIAVAIVSIASFIIIKNKPEPKPIAEVAPYDHRIDRREEGYSIDFSNIRIAESDIKVGKVSQGKVKSNVTIKKGEETLKDKPQLGTEVVWGSNTLKFENAKVTLKKTGDVNALISCSVWNEDKNRCETDWELEDQMAFHETDDAIEFEVKHFSAYAGAYLEIINLQSNLTQGGTWTTFFQTYSRSDLVIEAVDGTDYPEDIEFQSISCGDTQIESSRIERSGNTITVREYQCDGQQSNIKNTAVTSGRHWLSFTFGDTVGALAHNFACDSGTLDDTCTVSTVQTMANGDNINGTGNLIIASGGNLTAAAGNRFTINMGGDITVQSGGTITGNVDATSANFTIDEGGTINVDGKGYAAQQGDGAGNRSLYGSSYYGSGAGHAGNGGISNRSNNIAEGGTTHGSPIEPVSLGSGGGDTTGGAGGGAVKISSSGTATINGTISANGSNGSYSVSHYGGGGSGGSVWISTDIISGNSSITANGGNGNNAPYNGAGGGGRIAITYNDASGATLTKQAYGGSAGHQKGGAGTIYTRDMDDPVNTNGDLLVDNGAVNGVNTTQNASHTFDNVTIQNNAKYVIPEETTLSVTNSLTGNTTGTSLTINGTLDYTGTTISNLGTFTNSGTLEVPNLTTISEVGTFTNDQETLDFPSLTTITDATFINSAGKTVNFETSEPVVISSAPGTVIVNFDNLGTINFSSPDVSFALFGTDTFLGTSYSTLGNSGSITFPSDGQLNISGAKFANNAGAIFQLPVASTISNITNVTNAGTMTAESGASMTFSAITTFNNSGTLDGVTNLTVTGAGTFNHSGSLPNVTDLTIGDGATFSYNKNTNWSFANLTIDSGGTLTHAANSTTALGKQYAIDFTLSGNLTVNGTINVDGKGYALQQGPGAGINLSSRGSGAGYGGNGGNSSTGAVGGSTYGSPIEPIDLGSGGGNTQGGVGGGAIKISASGTTAINGAISTNGTSGAYLAGNYGGGGSGGSVWINTNILSGSASITANGGNGYNNAGGDGGGGRIAITYNDASGATLTKQAYGGSTGYQKGGAGTIYTRDMDDPVNTNGDLLVGNNTSIGGVFSDTTQNASHTFDSVTIQNNVKYVIPAEITLSVTNLLTGNTTGTSLTINGELNHTGTTISNINTITNNSDIINFPNLTTITDTTFINSAGKTVNFQTTEPVVISSTSSSLILASAVIDFNNSGTVNFSSSDVTFSLIGAWHAIDYSTLENSGSITFPSGGNLSVSGTRFINSAGANFQLPATSSISNITTITNAGTMAAASGANVTISTVATFTNSGTLTLPATNTISTVTNFTNSGTIDGVANLTVIGAGTFNQTGVVGDSGLNLTIGNGATFSYNKNTNWSFANLTIDSGGILTHGQNSTSKAYAIDFTLSGNLTVNGIINVDGKGYGSSSGAGEGTDGARYGGGGAGYGGNGGIAQNSAAGGVTYGSATEPVDLGSGGGNSVYSSYTGFGGRGGGSVKLNVSGTATISGDISANGGNGTSSSFNTCGGGGSGGSIWINANVLSGSASITANGGNGSSAIYAGRGGGGRIAIYATSGSHSGSRTANKGVTGYSTSGSDGTVIYDPTLSAINITSICSAAGNACTTGGSELTPQQAFTVANLAGTAQDSESIVKAVYVSLRDVTPDTPGYNLYYDGSGNFDEASEYWLTASTDPAVPNELGGGTVNWSYDSSSISYALNHTYEVRVRVANPGTTITDNFDTVQFIFVNSPPTVSNVTASQSSETGLVNVTYDVADEESTNLTMRLTYFSGATLSGDLDASSTDPITISSADIFPSNGYIVLDDETIRYSAKSENTLTGITRGSLNTTPATHTTEANVYILANNGTSSISGDVGTVAKGTGKTMVWTPTLDTTVFYITEGNIKVFANDGASFSMVGQAQSPNLEIDTKVPAVTLSVDGSTQFGENPSTIHINLTDDTMSEGGRGTMMFSLSDDFSGGSYIPYAATSSFALDNVNDTDTLYWRFKDGYNNITQGSNTLPQRPPHYMVQDTSNMAVTPPVYALFTGWAEVAEPASGTFLQYNILRSLAEDDTQYQKIGDTVETAKELNYYNDSTVEFDTNYYYKVTSEDSNNNISFRSTSSWGKANGTQDAGEGGGGSETTAPTISNVNAAATSTQATITWDTDELSNSYVGYSTTAGNFTSTKSSTSMVDNAEGVGQHRIVITNLVPGTTYYYRVSSTDSAGNISTDNNGGDGFTFTTLSGPTITNIVANPVRNTQAVISWTTSENANSFVIYSTNSDMTGGIEAGNEDSSTSHSVTLSALISGTTYYYFVRSGNTIDDNGGAYYSFTTTSDTSLPEITFDPATGITNLTNTSATIQWETNKATTGKVSYGTTDGSYSSFQENTSLNYDHRIDLTNLSPNTIYYFKLESTDENNNTAAARDVDGDFTFTTLETADTTGPVITNVATSNTTPTSATITWTTDENSSSFVQYSSDRENFATTYKETGKSDDSTTSHLVTIDGLTQGTTYYFKVKSVDTNTNETLQGNGEGYYTFDSSEGPTVTDVAASPSLTSATITWTTDSNSNAYVIYTANSDFTGTQEKGYSAKSGTSQSVTLEGLTAGVTYYYKVRSANEANGVTTQGMMEGENEVPFSFVAATDTTAPEVSNVTASSITENSALIIWTTDEAATSQVQYGTSEDALGSSTVLNSNLNVNHAQVVTGLSADTTYYFKVISEDGSGNVSESGINSFITLQSTEFQHDPLSEITNVRASLVTDENAVITLSTDQDAICFGELRLESGEYGTITPVREEGYDSGRYTTEHSIKFTSLIFGTTYHYRITCEDNLDSAVSTTDPAEYSFLTLQKQADHTMLESATHDSAPTVSTVTDTEVVITFNAGTSSTSKICLASQEGIDMGTCEAAANEIENSRIHSYHITGLSPDTLRYVRMRITDSEDSEDTYDTNEVSFRTLQAQVDHISLSSADHDASPTVTMKSDIEAIATFNAGTNATSKLCYSTTENIDMATCDGEEIETASKLQSFHLTGLSASTTYYMKMLVRDSENLEDTYTSEEASFVTLETQLGTSQIGVSDSTAPEISGVSIGNITGESATITWNTNENANSLVAYEIEGATYSMMAGDSIVNLDKEKFTTSHSVQIFGLIPSTKYLYKIISYDVSGNISQAYQSSFTTKEPSSLSSIKIISKAMGQATITWKTSKDTTSKVRYGLTTAYEKTEEDNTRTKEHELTISDLTAGETYHLRVESKDTGGNQYVSSDMTFEPKSPPQISDYKVDSITEHGAKVLFTTNIPTDALVTYTDSEKEENSGFQGRPELTAKHEVELKNMASGVKFSIKIKVRDEEGNETEEEFEGFSTTKDENPPKIDEVRTDSALTQSEKVQTIISWKTDEAATTSLLYKESRGGQDKEVKISDNFTTGHIAVLTSFKLGTVYYIKVKSEDQNGNVATSGQYTLLTPQRKQNIIQIIASNFQDIFGWVGGVK